MFRKLGLVTLAGCLSALSFGQEAKAQEQEFSNILPGLYIGASAGWGINKTWNDYSDSDGLTSSIREHAKGGLVSVALGYDQRIGSNFLLGGFVNFDLSDFKRGSDGAYNGLTIDRAWYFGGRAGYYVTPSTMLFVSGGYTIAHFDNEGWWDIETFGPTLAGVRSRNFGGYFVGAGFERHLNGNFFFHGEFRYSDFETEISNEGSFAGTTFVDYENPELYTGRVGITYKFGVHEPSEPSPAQAEFGKVNIIVYGGYDVAKDLRSTIFGTLMALNGDFEASGPVFRSQGILSQYTYGQGTALGANDVYDRSIDVMIGYMQVYSAFSALGYVGYEVRDVHLAIDDYENKLRGTDSGIKLAFDLESNDNQPVYYSWESSWSSAFNSYYAELRVGFKAPQFIIGPEGMITSDVGDRTERLGAFVTIPFQLTPSLYGELTVNGGHQFTEGGTGGSKGGEGGYVGSIFKIIW
jgi:opacity protein-like surface antigen